MPIELVPVLTTENITIYERDLDSLSPGTWITDSIIDAIPDLYPNSSITCIQSSSVSLLLASSLEYDDIVPLLPPNLTNDKIIVFPLNSIEQTGHWMGSHWSLLVLADKWYHFDSMSPSNSSLAANLVRKLQPLKKGNVQEVKVQRQDNGYDCGIYTITFLKAILGGTSPLQISSIQVNADKERESIKSKILESSQ